MSKEQINELLTGAAAVALAYALYKRFKQGGAAAPKVGKMPFNAQAVPNYDGTYGAPYNVNTVPGQMKLIDLLQGSVDVNVNFTGADTTISTR